MATFWSAIVTGAILSAPLSLVVWLALFVTPRHALNAATRYAIWWIVLLVTLMSPLVYLASQPAKRARPAVRIQATRSPMMALQSQPVSASGRPAARGIQLPIEIPASRWLRAMSFLWIAGSLFLLMRVFVSYGALYRRSARATDAPGSHNRVAGGRRIRIAISNEIGIPVATGPFSPAILIPSQLFEQIGAADLDRIISHEAAHLARRDDYALFIQRIIEALFALHPVVRWVTRQIDLEREIACDDVVVGSTDQARSYADCLTRMVALCGGVRPSLAASSVSDSRSHLSRRIELLVARRRTMQTQVLAGRLAIIAIALVCAAEMLAKTPLLVAFAIPPSADPSSATPHIVEGSDPPARKTHAFQPDTAQPILIAQSPIVAQGQIELGKKANSQVAAKDFDGAIATYQTLLAEVISPADKGDLWGRISEAYRLKGDFSASIQALEKAVALVPKNAPMLTNLALLYDAQGDFVHALQYYQQSLAINPNNWLVLNNVAYALAETGGDLNLALTDARTAKQNFPAALEIDDTLGWIYLKKAMLSAAVDEFQIAIKGAPANPEYRYHYALALYQQGKRADALSECKVALLDHPKIAVERNLRDLMDKLTPQLDTRPPAPPAK